MIAMRTKRYVMPVFWPIPRKRETYVTSPRPGPHGKQRCIPLQVILRDILGFAETGREVKTIVSAGKVLVDKRVRKERGYPIGLQDVLEIPDAKKQYRVVVKEKGLALEEIPPAEADRKLCRITDKTVMKGGLVQLNCHDGRNLTVKDAKGYATGDSILISLPEQAIIKHFPIKEGEPAVITAGKNIGARGKIKKIKRRTRMQEESTVSIQARDREIQTLLGYVMVGEIAKGPVPKKTLSRKERVKPRAARKKKRPKKAKPKEKRSPVKTPEAKK